ncbi:MAG: peptidoglycan DD-metalloendopeptidase family protein [Gammaproteobacteria bacterium]|nr:peptidoglycan DD-metalloendopeptidase family protein [Gammaproteobacteria bacterium]
MANSYLFNAYHPGSTFKVNDPWVMRFHPKKHKWAMHAGQDFPAPMDTPIPAAAKGTVYNIEDIAGYGHCVVLQHTPLGGSPVYYTLYAHLSQKPPIELFGKTIEAGATIGLVGMSGISTGPHLHFEVIPNQKLPLVGGHTTLDPLTFTDWGGLPHTIGADASGHPILTKIINGVVACWAVDSTGTLIQGVAVSDTGNPSLNTPYDAAHPGSQYWVIDSLGQIGRLYDNGVLYTVDKQSKQEFWSIPTTTGGTQEVTKFSTGLITTVTYDVDGNIDTTTPATVTLDTSASADVKAAFDAWVAAGNDPSNVNPADLHLDQTAGGVTNLLDARPDIAIGITPQINAVLIGESPASGTGGDMLRGGIGNDLLIGSSGEDVLYGGGGNDAMAGGAGDDTYILDGAGQVTIEDKIGNNRVLLNGRELGVLIRQADGSFKSADGKISGALQGGDLILVDDTGAHNQRGQLRI